MFKFIVSLSLLLLSNVDLLSSREKFPYPRIKLGVDILIEQNFSLLTGQRVGLLCNSASRASDGKLSVEHFISAPNFDLKAIFTPEHGFYGNIPAGKYVLDDSIYGLPVFSLYGNNRKPTQYQMSLIDVIVVDLQDIGIRSYTFISTLAKVLESAAENNKQVIVLDRPNPLGGEIVDGNVLDLDKTSFVGIAPIAYIHGCTIGELAIMFNEEGWIGNGKKLKANLLVIKMENWQRVNTWEDTGLRWYATSPNIPSVDAIRGSALLGVFGELHLFNLGIGTKYPFQFLALNNKNIQKLKEPIQRILPTGIQIETKFYGELKTPESKTPPVGFLFKFDKNLNAPFFTLGFKIILELRRAFPNIFEHHSIPYSRKTMFNKVIGNERLLDSLCKSTDSVILSQLNEGLSEFIKLRSKYLLYK
ncbi:MAG: exo-beta-N-acetylmuramidase NamZ family protein [Candidatus Kapaibacteriales bacterium]